MFIKTAKCKNVSHKHNVLKLLTNPCQLWCFSGSIIFTICNLPSEREKSLNIYVLVAHNVSLLSVLSRTSQEVSPDFVSVLPFPAPPFPAAPRSLIKWALDLKQTFGKKNPISVVKVGKYTANNKNRKVVYLTVRMNPTVPGPIEAQNPKNTPGGKPIQQFWGKCQMSRKYRMHAKSMAQELRTKMFPFLSPVSPLKTTRTSFASLDSGWGWKPMTHNLQRFLASELETQHIHWLCQNCRRKCHTAPKTNFKWHFVVHAVPCRIKILLFVFILFQSQFVSSVAIALLLYILDHVYMSYKTAGG